MVLGTFRRAALVRRSPAHRHPDRAPPCPVLQRDDDRRTLGGRHRGAGRPARRRRRWCASCSVARRAIRSSSKRSCATRPTGLRPTGSPATTPRRSCNATWHRPASAISWRNASGGCIPDTRAIFDAAAVLGERFELADVAHLVGRRAAAIGDDMEALHAQGLFQPAGVTRRRSSSRIRSCAKRRSPCWRHVARRSCTTRAAKRLERAGADERARHLPQLAYHAFAALPLGSIGKAVRYGQAAAAQAASHFAYEDAAALYRRDAGGGGAAAARRQRWNAPSCWSRSARSRRGRPTRTTARAAAIDGFRLAQRQRRPDLVRARRLRARSDAPAAAARHRRRAARRAAGRGAAR